MRSKSPISSLLSTPLSNLHNRPSSSELPLHLPSSEPITPFERRLQQLEAKFSQTLTRIDQLELHTNLKRKHFPLSPSEHGILSYLRISQPSPIERRFLCSQSSADLYGILSPTLENYYGSPDNGDCWLQFEFKHEITIFGFVIQSYLSCFLKSYRIVCTLSDGSEKVVFSTDSEIGLCGELKEITHTFQPPAVTRIIRIEQTGPSWDETNFIGIKRIDFLTDCCQGLYFEYLLQFCNCDPHRLPVKVTARYFDTYEFCKRKSESYICTFDCPIPSWFQIEFVEGKVSVCGYRMRKHEMLRLKRWTLRGSNDVTLKLNDWVIIHGIDEPEDSDLFGIYNCEFSGEFKYLRIVMETPGWNNRSYLAFWHFEVFGDYILD
jgi:hypothetical protein